MEEQWWFANNHYKYKVWDLLLLEVKIDHEQWLLIHPWVFFFFSFRKQSGAKWFAQPDINEFSESEVTCGQVCGPILWICALHLTHPSAHTQQWTHTHCEHTPKQWAAILLRWPGSSWGFGALLKGSTSVVVLKVEESTGYSLQNLNGLIIETV